MTDNDIETNNIQHPVRHKASVWMPEDLWQNVCRMAKLKSRLDQKYVKPSDIFRHAVDEYIAKRLA